MLALRTAFGVGLGLVALSLPLEARAFECTPVPLCPASNSGCTATGNPTLSQAWYQRCVPVWIRRSDPIFAGETLEELVVRSFAQWTSALPGTDFEILFMGYTDQGGGFDVEEPRAQQNVVLAARDQAETMLYFDDPGLLAITLTTFSTETGEILDADIVFNDVASDFEIVSDVVSCLARRGGFDIENTLVHEAGHFFGFDHVDLPDATMFASAERCEIKKRDLDADDRLAMTTVYPAGGPTMTCLPPADSDLGGVDEFRDQCARALEEGCSCRAPGDRHRASSLLLALPVLALLRLRPKRRAQAGI